MHSTALIDVEEGWGSAWWFYLPCATKDTPRVQVKLLPQLITSVHLKGDEVKENDGTMAELTATMSKKAGGTASRAWVPLMDTIAAAASSAGLSATRKYTVSPNTRAGLPCTHTDCVCNPSHQDHEGVLPEVGRSVLRTNAF